MKTGPFKMKGKSPMMKALIGKQNNLPAELKAKILASPATMKKESMAPMKKESMAKMKKAPAKMKKESMAKMKKKSMTKMKKGDRPKPDPTGYDPVEKPKKTTYEKAAKKDSKLGDYVKQRKNLKKGTPEYAKVQNKINAAYGVKKRYNEGKSDVEITMSGTGDKSNTNTEGKNQNASKPNDSERKSKRDAGRQKRLARNEKQKAMAKDLKYRLLGKAGRAKMVAKGYVPKSKKK